MINVFKKFSIYIVILLFLITSPAYARQMSLTELGKEIDALQEEYSKETGEQIASFYIIGEYVFTTHIQLDTKDIMLASRSIKIDDFNVKDPKNSLSKVGIYFVQRDYDDFYQPKGWTVGDNFAGESKIDLTDDKKVEIKYIDYKYYAEESKAEIKFNISDEYYSYLQSGFGISKETKLYDNLSYDSTTGELTGLMLHYDIEKGFSGDDKTGYYLPFVIEVPGLTEDTTVTIKEDKTIKASYTNFDIKNKENNKEPGMVVLWSIPGEGDEPTKKITITIDLDGEGTEYGETTYTINYSGLTFQGESKAQGINMTGASEADKTILKDSWGYDSSKNKGEDGKSGSPSLTVDEGDPFTYKLKGTLVEQKLNELVYGTEQADGYYFDFTIELENNSEKKAVISAKNLTSDQVKTFVEKEYDDKGNLTILQRIDKNSACVTGQDKEKEKCVVEITIDLDGEGDEYYPVIYRIDYSEVKFEKTSFFTVSALGENHNKEFGDDGKWYDTDHGYFVDVKADENDNAKYYVTGILPIFDDASGWEVNKHNTFDTTKNLYYLGLLLKLVDPPKELEPDSGLESTINVKFYHNDGKEDDQFLKLYDGEFDTSHELYILKALCENTTDGSGDKISDAEKVFTITVDLDGEEQEEYAPYTVTIDWSGLVLQAESTGDFGNYDIVESSNDLAGDSEAQKALEDYKYDYSKSSGVSIKTEYQDETEHDSKKGLQGKIKEQTLDKSSGFKELEGYFIPIKVEFPGNDIPELKDYKNSWTIILNTEDGNTKEYTPTQAEYDQGWVMVLFKIKDKEEKVIKYSIDYDGLANKETHKGYDFLPFEYTINYDELSFLEAEEVKINGEKEENVNIYVGEPIPTEILTQLETEQVESIDEEFKPYRDFAYFTTDNEEQTIVNDKTNVTQDMIKDGSINLIPHWNLYSDKFVADVLEDLNKTADSKSENFSTEFEIEDYVENSGEVTINVINPDVKVSRMNDTSIPGAIAHILLADEIKEITLIADSSNSKKFTKGEASDKDDLKEKIKAGTKELYSPILTKTFAGDDNSVTLSQLAQNGEYKTFTLKINTDNMSKNVTLVKTSTENGISMASENTAPTEYTFTFKSDVVSVNSVQTLKDALDGHATTIYIAEGFDATEKFEVNRSVTINGNSQTLTATTTDSIFDIKTSDVKIENLTLKAGNETKTLVNVEPTGDLTASNLTITPADTNNLEAAIEVKSGGKVNITGLKYEKEHYNHPAIKAAKDNVNINLTDIENKKATATEKEKFTVNSTGNDTISKDTEYNKSYRNYYNDPKNSTIYKSVLYNYQGSYRVSYTKYNYYNDKVSIPDLDPFKSFTHDGEKYDLIAFSESSVNLLRSDESTQDGDIKTEDLKATKNDAHYWAVFKVTLPAGVKIVDDESSFKAAISDGETQSIYVTKPLEIDYTKEEGGTLKINKNLSIIGTAQLTLVIKANKVEIGADTNDVFFNRVNFQIQAQNDQKALIEVNGQNLSIWQSSLKNTGTSVDYGIKYNNQTSSVVDVRYVGTSGSGFSESNINKGYIYVDGKMDEGSTLISNTFPNIAGKTTSVIIINGFTDKAAVTPDKDGEPDIRFEGNTVKTPYSIVFTKNTSDQNADIKLGNSKIKIGVEYDDDKKNFKGIGLFANPSNVEFAYLKETEAGEYQEEAQKPDGVEQPTIKSVVEGVPGVADNSANNLVQTSNGKYSGTIAQSSDGNFYLPITLSSVKFEERTSKITVTDPNQNTESYLYTAYNENGLVKDTKNVARINSINGLAKSSGTITLNLEAIKTSKIRGGNKAYTIAIDYDGNGEDEATYPIDYNGVKTEEEIILAAAEKTQAANSYTIEKDNSIKGGIEKFTYKIDKNNETRLYEGEVNNEQVQQYAFKYGDNGLYFVAEKSKKIDQAIPGREDLGTRPKLNEWTYFNRFNKIATGVNELTLLQDLNANGAITDAIEEVKQDETANTYIVTVNKEVLEHWLNAEYIDGHMTEEEEKNSGDHTSDNASITLKVTLDSNKEYVTKVETTENFTIKKTSEPETEYKNNRINVTIKDINNTTVDGPKKMLGKDQTEVSDDDIKAFIEAGQNWWHKYTGSTSA